MPETVNGSAVRRKNTVFEASVMALSFTKTTVGGVTLPGGAVNGGGKAVNSNWAILLQPHLCSAPIFLSKVQSGASVTVLVPVGSVTGDRFRLPGYTTATLTVTSGFWYPRVAFMNSFPAQMSTAVIPVPGCGGKYLGCRLKVRQETRCLSDFKIGRLVAASLLSVATSDGGGTDVLSADFLRSGGSEVLEATADAGLVLEWDYEADPVFNPIRVGTKATSSQFGTTVSPSEVSSTSGASDRVYVIPVSMDARAIASYGSAGGVSWMFTGDTVNTVIPPNFPETYPCGIGIYISYCSMLRSDAKGVSGALPGRFPYLCVPIPEPNIWASITPNAITIDVTFSADAFSPYVVGSFVTATDFFCSSQTEIENHAQTATGANTYLYSGEDFSSGMESPSPIPHCTTSSYPISILGGIFGVTSSVYNTNGSERIPWSGVYGESGVPLTVPSTCTIRHSPRFPNSAAGTFGLPSENHARWMGTLFSVPVCTSPNQVSGNAQDPWQYSWPDPRTFEYVASTWPGYGRQLLVPKEVRLRYAGQSANQSAKVVTGVDIESPSPGVGGGSGEIDLGPGQTRGHSIALRVDYETSCTGVKGEYY